jgi:hypothetical protein
MIVGLGLGIPAQAQSGDPMLGTWTLNVPRSTHAPGDAAQAGTRTYTQVGAKIAMVSVVVGTDGRTTKSGFFAAIDGVDYPVTGDSTYDAIALSRADVNTVRGTLKQRGKIVATTISTVYKDGKTLEIEHISRGAHGVKLKTVTYWDRRPGAVQARSNDQRVSSH